jgi:hypothetical protein
MTRRPEPEPSPTGVSCRHVWAPARGDLPCQRNIGPYHRCCLVFRPVDTFSGLPVHTHRCPCGALHKDLVAP